MIGISVGANKFAPTTHSAIALTKHVDVLAKSPTLPTALPLWAIVVLIGGFIGSELGRRRLATPVIQKVLALVLVIAGVKMILIAW